MSDSDSASTSASVTGGSRAAEALAYLSPYLFWSLVCVLTGSIWLLA